MLHALIVVYSTKLWNWNYASLWTVQAVVSDNVLTELQIHLSTNQSKGQWATRTAGKVIGGQFCKPPDWGNAQDASA